MLKGCLIWDNFPTPMRVVPKVLASTKRSIAENVEYVNYLEEMCRTHIDQPKKLRNRQPMQ